MSKIHLAFLWHQHQPFYKNPLTGVYDMPWVRLHATKDYYDLAAVLDDFPNIRFNINLVPSLMKQLDDYATGTAKDRFVDVTLIPADSISEEDLLFLLQNFFMANWDTMIAPNPRYAELLMKRGKYFQPGDLRRIKSYFKKQDILDLQVWFNLSWVDPYWRKKDPFIKYLYEKGRNFTEEEKKILIDKHLQICAAVIPKHRELQDRHQAEISTTPFYHPILPLLCDTNSARMAIPHIRLPEKRFKNPDDARQQIRTAISFYEEKFGTKPRGFWPSEGSVSEEVVSLFAAEGINWLATDEEVLFRTAPELYNASKINIYEPYRVELPGGAINFVFRDHALSDAIGFVYAKWGAKDAAKDFISRIHEIRKSLPATGNHLVSVILDGENCWEYYKNDGHDFLGELFERISKDDFIISTTISDYIKKHPPRKKLRKLHAGSWIGANFGIWIGHQEDNLSWDYLYDARKFLTDYIANNPEKKDSPEVKQAWEYLYIAEGSDWNWWYGDDHSSAMDMMFDSLYRANLQKIYEILGAKPPDYLYIAIKGKYKLPPMLEPVDFLKINIDGTVNNYYEWLNSGFYQAGQSGGSMHKVECIIKAIYYGFDLENLYLRLDTDVLKTPEKLSELSFNVRFFSPAGCEAIFSFDNALKPDFFIINNGSKEKLESISAKRIIELAIPFKSINTRPGDRIEFVVVLTRKNYEIERCPQHVAIGFNHPDKNYFAKVWSV